MTEEQQTIVLRQDFYRDSFSKVIGIMISLVLAILALFALSIYLYVNKPKPIAFTVQDEWRVQAAVPINEEYLSDAEVLQWVSDVVSKVFTFDFILYNKQLGQYQQYFTENGWGIFLNHLNSYANYNNVQSYRLFVHSSPSGAPFIVNQQVLAGRYAWWVQVPITINYKGYQPPASQFLTLQVLVTRVSTLNNLMGVGIDNVIISQNKVTQLAGDF